MLAKGLVKGWAKMLAKVLAKTSPKFGPKNDHRSGQMFDHSLKAFQRLDKDVSIPSPQSSARRPAPETTTPVAHPRIPGRQKVGDLWVVGQGFPWSKFKDGCACVILFVCVSR